MKKVSFIFTACMAILVVFAAMAQAEETTVLFGFENGLEGWDVPNWAYEKPDHSQKNLQVSEDFASEGEKSLTMEVEFPGGRWAGAIVEITQFFDWTAYSSVSCDVLIPDNAPAGLKATMILTVGPEWKWVEMSRSINLEPGKWVTLAGDLSVGSADWRREHVSDAFRQDVRKIDIRVYTDNDPAYTGNIYIDNVRVAK